MDRSALFDEFVRRLNGSDSRAVPDPGGAFILISRWRGRDVVPPVRLMADAPALERHLHDMEGAGVEVFPGAAPLIGAMQLFHVHVEEEIRTRKLGEEVLAIRGGRLRFVDGG